MAQEPSHVQRFNTDTMSGVFPGARPLVWQRVRLVPAHYAQAEKTARVEQDPAMQWAQLSWYADPAACELQLLTQGEPGQPVLRLHDPLAADFLDALQSALRAAGWQLHSCGTCHFWHACVAHTPDGLPLGRCHWASTAEGEVADTAAMARQSCLALGCTHWTARDASAAEHAPQTHREWDPPEADPSTDTKVTAAGPWHRLWHAVARWMGGATAAQTDMDTAPSAATRWLERSGVGAGTEACLTCHGRMANLGALAVASVEGDRQTVSVWRCRRCQTFYLNHWIDRWERLDSLETDESYYRIAPGEAVELLLRMEAVTDGAHPGRRSERTAERVWFERFMAGREPLSHQVKLGR